MIILNVKPLSVNEAWQGRRYKTEKYLSFEEEVLYSLPRKSVKGEVEIHIIFHLKNYAKTDIDNLLKPLLDCLVKKGCIEDDRKVIAIYVRKLRSQKDRIYIDILPVDNSSCVFK